MNKNKPGWALFEVIVVLAIFAFIAVLSTTFIGVSSYSYAKIELERLYAFCMFLQSKATLEKRDIVLKFDSNISYYCENDKYKLSLGIEFGVLPDAKGPPSAPKNLLEKAITYPNKKIVFYKDGTISSGTVYITDINRSFLLALTTAVSQYSYIRKYVWQNKKWHELSDLINA